MWTFTENKAINIFKEMEPHKSFSILTSSKKEKSQASLIKPDITFVHN